MILTPEIEDLLETLVNETRLGSHSQPVAAGEVTGDHYNNAQRDFMLQVALEIAQVLRLQERFPREVDADAIKE